MRGLSRHVFPSFAHHALFVSRGPRRVLSIGQRSTARSKFTKSFDFPLRPLVGERSGERTSAGGRELHLLKSGGFHGALFRQLTSRYL
jgi:hypothetical protein